MRLSNLTEGTVECWAIGTRLAWATLGDSFRPTLYKSVTERGKVFVLTEYN